MGKSLWFFVGTEAMDRKENESSCVGWSQLPASEIQALMNLHFVQYPVSQAPPNSLTIEIM